MKEDKDWSGQPAGKDHAGYYRILTNKLQDERCRNCQRKINEGEKYYIANEQIEFKDGETDIQTERWCKKCFIKLRVTQEL